MPINISFCSRQSAKLWSFPALYPFNEVCTWGCFRSTRHLPTSQPIHTKLFPYRGATNGDVSGPFWSVGPAPRIPAFGPDCIRGSLLVAGNLWNYTLIDPIIPRVRPGGKTYILNCRGDVIWGVWFLLLSLISLPPGNDGRYQFTL